MSKEVPAAELAASIRPGDRVTILIPNGIGRNGPEFKEVTGRTVIAPNGRDQLHAVINTGNEARPYVADKFNIVRIGQRIATPEITDTIRSEA